MSGGDVHRDEMNEPHEFDDAAADALLGGSGREIDPDLADLIGDVRVAYTSTPPVVGAPLAALMGASLPAADQPDRRFERMRRSLLAKCGAAFAVAMAATSGLAVAGALPPPVQNALSNLGVGESSNHHHATTASETDDSTTTTTTTVAGDPTTTVGKDHPDNHGDEVSGVAHDDANEGCEHGHAVAAVASGGKSHGQPCKTTSTTVEGTTPTSEAENGNDNDADDVGQNENGNQDHQNNGKQDDNGDNGDGHHSTPTTTATNDGGHHGDHSGDGGGGTHDGGGSGSHD